MQDLARHGVEECLLAFRLLVVDQQPDVIALDLLPARLVDPVAAEFALQPRDRLHDATIVEVDPILRRVRNRQPVAGLEVAFGRASAIAEQRVVVVEALKGRLRDCRRLGGRRDADRARARGGMQRGGRGHGHHRALASSVLQPGRARDRVTLRRCGGRVTR